MEQLSPLDYIPFQATFLVVATSQYLTAEIIDVTLEYARDKPIHHLNFTVIEQALHDDNELRDLLLTGNSGPDSVQFKIGIRDVFQQISAQRGSGKHMSRSGVKYINNLLNNLMYQLTNIALTVTPTAGDQFKPVDFAKAIQQLPGTGTISEIQHNAIMNAETVVMRATEIKDQDEANQLR